MRGPSAELCYWLWVALFCVSLSPFGPDPALRKVGPGPPGSCSECADQLWGQSEKIQETLTLYPLLRNVPNPIMP